MSPSPTTRMRCELLYGPTVRGPALSSAIGALLIGFCVDDIIHTRMHMKRRKQGMLPHLCRQGMNLQIRQFRPAAALSPPYAKALLSIFLSGVATQTTAEREALPSCSMSDLCAPCLPGNTVCGLSKNGFFPAVRPGSPSYRRTAPVQTRWLHRPPSAWWLWASRALLISSVWEL